MSEPLLVSASDDGVLRLTLNRPAKRNALNHALAAALVQSLSDANNDDAVRIICLDGRGPAFCAGLDLEEALSSSADRAGDVYARLFSITPALRKPLVAVVHGAALGGGLGLALCAHFVVASAPTKCGLIESRIGLWPYWVFRLAENAVGRRKAIQLAIEGRVLDASEALSIGLFDQVVAADRLPGAVEALVSSLSGVSPRVVRAGLELISLTRGLDDASYARVASEFRRHAQDHHEFRDAVRTYLERRRTSLHGEPT